MSVVLEEIAWPVASSLTTPPQDNNSASARRAALRPRTAHLRPLPNTASNSTNSSPYRSDPAPCQIAVSSRLRHVLLHMPCSQDLTLNLERGRDIRDDPLQRGRADRLRCLR